MAKKPTALAPAKASADADVSALLDEMQSLTEIVHHFANGGLLLKFRRDVLDLIERLRSVL